MTNRRQRIIVIGVAVCLLAATPFSNTVRCLRDKEWDMHPTFIYKGVRTDVGMLRLGGEWTFPLWWKVLVVLDLPVSLFADTVCLPYTAYRTLTEPRKIAVWHISQEDRGPGWIIDSDVVTEQRRIVPAREVCKVIRTVQGKPKGVEVLLMADNSVPISEFKLIYEIILSNPALTVFYTHNAIETNFLEVCYPDKKDPSNEPVEATR